MKRILYTCSTLARSGPTNQLFEILRNIDRQKFEPIILTLSSEPANSRKKDFEALNISIYSLNSKRISGFFKNKGAFKKYLKKICPDLIHSQGLRADILVSSCKGAIPTLMTARNYPYDDYPKKYGFWVGRAMGWSHLRAFKTSHLIACSKSICAQIKNYGIDCQPIQNGVDTDFFSPVDAEEKKALRLKLNLPLDKIILIHVGSFIERKNPSLIIQAFQQSKMKEKGALIMVGTGSLLPICKKLVTDNDPVYFPGFSSDPRLYLRAADIFVSAASSEGLPGAVLEGMASGLACILSDIPPHKEIFGKGKHNVSFFPTESLEELKMILNRLTSEEVTTLQSASLELVRRSFSSKKMASEYQQVYSQLLG